MVNHTSGDFIRHNTVSATTPFIIHVDVIPHEFYIKLADYLLMDYKNKDKLYKPYPKFCMSSSWAAWELREGWPPTADD